jgi:ZIP family zinc transporter
MWTALFWGLFASASLYLGQLLARPMGRSEKAIGLLMGFGAGTMISAVAYELVPASSFSRGWAIGVFFLAGALAYYFGDRWVDSSGGKQRSQIRSEDGAGSGSAMFLGALLDGVPESFILGLGLALGGSISIAFVAAVFISNVPQGLAGTTSLEDAGTSDRKIAAMWGWLTIACGIASLVGYVTAHQLHGLGADASAFAGGAVLMMLTDSMVPESYRHGGRLTGLFTVVGFLVAAVLNFIQ